jgi:hypothetical protein
MPRNEIGLKLKLPQAQTQDLTCVVNGLGSESLSLPRGSRLLGREEIGKELERRLGLRLRLRVTCDLREAN